MEADQEARIKLLAKQRLLPTAFVQVLVRAAPGPRPPLHTPPPLTPAKRPLRTQSRAQPSTTRAQGQKYSSGSPSLDSFSPGGITIVPRSHGLSAFSAITQPSSQCVAALALSGKQATFPFLRAIQDMVTLEKAVVAACVGPGVPRLLRLGELNGCLTHSVLEGIPSALVHSASWCARISDEEGRLGPAKLRAAKPAWGFSWGLPDLAAAGDAAGEAVAEVAARLP